LSQPQQQPSYPPPPVEPTFQVRTIKHTGALVFWMNQRSTTTGSYAQCEAAIDNALRHCMLGGWWSLVSLLWNPISLSMNASARRTLRSQARKARDYAVWWNTYYGGGPHTPVWTPPPPQPAWHHWWMWFPLVVIGLFFTLGVLLRIAGVSSDHVHHSNTHQWAPTTTSWPAP